MRIRAIALPIALLACTSASAHRPNLTLDRADHMARSEADTTVNDWNDAYDPASSADPEDDPGAFVYITRYDLDPCEQISASSADCDVTYWLNDGEGCDATIWVRATRRGRITVGSDEPSCDGDA